MSHSRIALLSLAISLLLSSMNSQSVLRAHALGENYVWVNVEAQHLTGHFEIHFTDLREKLGLNLPDGGDEARDAVRMSAPEVQEYIREHFRMLVDGKEIPLEFTNTDVHELEQLGTFAQYFYTTPTIDVPDQLTIQNDLLYENDRFHRSLIAIEYNKKSGEEFGEEFAAMVFSASNNEQELDLNNISGLMQPGQFVWQGILHIWIGIDHILFLVALLLPAVLTRSEGKWVPVPSFRAAFWNIIKIVTIFTVAHSITLSLAALDIVRLPSQLVESVIALSIILVAMNGIFPMFREGVWLVIFFFGLFHGLGFATVMGHLPFRMMNLTKVLLAFNVGVEIGQIAIVAIVFPIIFLLRKTRFYVPLVLHGGSIVICAVAAYWFVQRAFGLG